MLCGVRPDSMQAPGPICECLYMHETYTYTHTRSRGRCVKCCQCMHGCVYRYVLHASTFAHPYMQMLLHLRTWCLCVSLVRLCTCALCALLCVACMCLLRACMSCVCACAPVTYRV